MSKQFEEKVLEKLGELDGIKEKVSRIDAIEEKLSEIDIIKEKVSEIDVIKEQVSEIGPIKDKLKNIEEKVENISISVLLIEDEVSNKIPALFDAYSFNYELQKETEKQINSLKQENFNHSVRISNLEIESKHHSKQIKKLIS